MNKEEVRPVRLVTEEEYKELKKVILEEKTSYDNLELMGIKVYAQDEDTK